MITKINHVGVIVKNIEEALDLYTKTLGFKPAEVLTSKEAGVKTVMISLGEVTLELTEPIDPQGGLQKFLEKRGEGIHHISLEVDDINQERDLLESKGIQFIDKKPEYFEGAFISFIHPKSTKGVLIELIQRLRA
ncbi:MAG: methylmalonyl-CoA epimerase [Thermodesulfobacteriota bacterium]|jgi:methylmalonyl-CoA epimerase